MFRLPGSLLLILALLVPSASAQDKQKPPKKSGPSIDWSLFAAKLTTNRIAFHLEGLDGKAVHSSSYWGAPLIVYVESGLGGENGPALRAVHQLVQRHASSGVKLVGLFQCTPEIDNGHMVRVKKYVDTEKLGGYPILIGNQQVRDLFAETPPAWPVFLFINRDGTVESNNFGWIKDDAGEEGKEGHLTARVKELIQRMAAKPKPAGKPPEPPPLEQVKPIEAAKEPEREPPTGSPE